MKKYPADFWNEMYGDEEFRYGTEPNAFFKAQLDKLAPGSILLPAEGEGRNATYAAMQGWEVTAFDISEKGRDKAIQLAKQRDVPIDYEVVGVLDFDSAKQFDAIGLSYAHFPADLREEAHSHLMKFLKPDGVVIFEAFAKAQLGKSSGGPQNIDMLFSTDEVASEFKGLDFKLFKEESIELSEGKYHKGEAQVIRFVGKKV